jgi:hypothetical protein
VGGEADEEADDDTDDDDEVEGPFDVVPFDDILLIRLLLH